VAPVRGSDRRAKARTTLFKLWRLGAWDDGSSGPWDIELLEDIVAVMEAEIVRQR